MSEKKDSKEPKKSSGFGALRAASQQAAPDDIDLPEVDGDDARSVQSPHPDATREIVRAAFESATDAQIRRRLRHGQALAVVVIVPAAEWVEPIVRHVRHAFGARWRIYRGSERREDSARSEDVARDLTHGLAVMGIAADIGKLPSVLTAAADLVVRVDPPCPEVLRLAIARTCGRSPGPLPAGSGAGMDLHRLVSSFRPGSGAKTIARRLAPQKQEDATKDDRVPDLRTAIEYGEARLWALDLAADIESYEAGRVEWQALSRGVVVEGPAGTGKTTLSRAVGVLCGIPVVQTSVASWFASGAGYLDSVIREMRRAFSEAAALANPSSSGSRPRAVALLHVDELDALPSRASFSSDNSDARARSFWLPIITDLLTLLDSSMSPRSGVVVMGSTNYVHMIDPALLRPGRLERVIHLGPPDAAGALSILRFHLAGDLADQDVAHLGPLLAGHSGAEIMMAVRDARRRARDTGRRLTIEDVELAVLPAPPIAPPMLRRMAVHEAAHAVAAMAVGSGAIEQVVLRADGPSGGRTVVTNRDDDLVTAHDIEDRVVVALAARAAEVALCGGASVGAGGSSESDLGSATAMIASLHGSFGLGESPLFIGEAGRGMRQELALNRDLRDRVEAHLKQLEARAAKVVAANTAAIEAVAEALAKRRHLTGAEVRAIVGGKLVHFVRGGDS